MLNEQATISDGDCFLLPSVSASSSFDIVSNVPMNALQGVWISKTGCASQDPQGEA